MEMKFREVLKAALLAGFISGAVASGFHLFLTEPVIDRAIEIEEQLTRSQGEKAEEPVVSRQAQRAGLILGFLLYGGAWGLLLGVLFYLGHPRFLSWTEAKRGLFLALALGWSVAVLPFLKYPANPPGVGDPETIAYRQGFYLGFIGLSVIGTLLALWLKQLYRLKWPVVLVGYAIFLALIYFVMPFNPDPIRMPQEIVWKFRALSLAGLLLFWVVLGGTFGWLSERAGHRPFRWET